jgi:hypothetical protein
MNKRLPDALEDCLKLMEQGESLASALAYHTELAAQLRPLLEAAMRARSGRQENLPATVLARSRARLLARSEDLRQGKNRSLVQRRFWRPAWTAFAVIAILVMSSNGLLIASAHSIPGDTLYPLKRSVESTQLQLVSDPAKKQKLEHTFSERRLDETKSLITRQRVESVEFTGVVSSQSQGEWLVSGIPVIVTAQTEIDKAIGIGDEVEVYGTTNAAGDVEAIRLSLDRDSDMEDDHPGLSPTQTPSPEDSHLEESPTWTSSLEDDHSEDSFTNTPSPEDSHSEDLLTKTPSPEDNHSEDSLTKTPSPEDRHLEASATQTSSPEDGHPEDSPTHTPSPDGSGESGDG